MISKRKKYSRPRRPFDKLRIKEENDLKDKYGLKNKQEIWRADSAIDKVRNLAKKLITKSEDEKQKFIEKLQKKGFRVNKLADVLTLDKEDWLGRRLQTIVFSKKLTTTPKQARQLIVHKHVMIGDRIVNIPSYQVALKEEPSVKLNILLKLLESKKSAEEKIEEEIIEGEEPGESLKDSKELNVEETN